ncbi:MULTISPECIES: aminotransferase class IV [Staphylococcus]|uniref:Aminodeoxychorismate lyase n=1 Tax=Staphylococcus shinii TaxID=2912228 RepID=A0A418IGA7_9STAP|nr:aminotransferase class IV [Staphylococcus shinii]MDW8564231.1 aminotransferase class IV [Staphylococcus shinii]MDW8567458.1 aminotransferase class IV [Staphylococcus shinii]MEC5301154.1 aminotransferase class IV [Staphylococcus shinii]PKI09841.1 aminodeoxychorismate lyase [Staphylococcus shinii]RIN01387.1 aminodeoxychorismate lyase [Staphylococcus shinii]
MQLFETMRLESGLFSRLSYHKNRMKNASEELGFLFDESAWSELIDSISEQYATGIYRLKILLNKDGTMEYVAASLPEKSTFTAKLLPLTSDVNKQVVINKTTQRAHLEHNHQTDIVLLYNEKGKVLEFDIGNVMIKENGHYYTPLYNEDFLRGCMRQELLDKGELLEKDFEVHELKDKISNNKVQIFLINSLREVAEVEIYL